jgi:hypothetical protein
MAERATDPTGLAGRDNDVKALAAVLRGIGSKALDPPS